MQRKKVGNWIRMYGLKNMVLRGLYTKLPLIPVDSTEVIRRMNWQMRVKKHLKQYIQIVSDDEKLEQTNPYKNTVWCLWFQGIENAPEIVKVCCRSVKKYLNKANYNLIYLDEKNVFDYIKIPDYIIYKWRKGIIGNAFFSDICRVALLAEYGGIWIDATVLLTGELNEEILNADLFFYQASFLDMSVTGISNWLIAAKNAGNGFLLSLRESLYNFWKSKQVVEDYFLFHLMVTELLTCNDLKKKFDLMPYMSNTYPHLLGKNLNEEFDEKVFDHILRNSNIHKLSYKNIEENKENSYYNYIINNYM